MARRNYLSRALGLAPPALKAPAYGLQGLLSPKKKKQKGLKKIKQPTTKTAASLINFIRKATIPEEAYEYAVSGEIPFNEDYWRKQAESVWGSYAAKQLAQLSKEATFTKKSATENLNLALERLGQERAFAQEDLSATLEELATERKWTQQEFNETLENINRTRQYLGEDFENTIQDLAYQRGIKRDEIAQELMPLAQQVRDEAWERGLGAGGLGAQQARRVEAARAKQIKRVATEEAFGKKAAGIVKTRGLEEQAFQEKRSKRILTQRGEEIGLRESAANRAYKQALARYGLQEKEARTQYGQTIGQADIEYGKARTGIEEQKKIGIEQFVQSRRGEAYQRAGAYPQQGIRRTNVRYARRLY